VYRLNYDVLLVKYVLDRRLLFTDTDSLWYHVKTEDLNGVLRLSRTSWTRKNYPKDSENDVVKALYSL